MRLRPEQLPAQLQKNLQSCYLVSGDELLLVQECCDQIRQACRAQGIDEREVLEVERGFDWNQLLAAGNSLSLFAERKMIELRLGGGKMDQKSSAALQEFLAQSDGSNILLMSCARLDKRSMNAKWVKAIENAGAVIQVWPVERRQLGGWITQRMKAKGMRADHAAVELLADRVEGNLLAAEQEIEKLRILLGDQLIDADTVASAVASSARYDVFKLIDAALAGDAALALRMHGNLLAEGGEEIPMLGAICRELRMLYQCAGAVEAGSNIDRALDNARIWDKRKPLYKRCLTTHGTASLGRLLQLAGRIDPALKGQSDEDGRLLFTQLVAALAGTRFI